MEEFSFDLAGMFEQTFGYKTQAFNPEFKEVTGDGNSLSLRTQQGAQGSPYYASDKLGNEYYMPVTLTYADDVNVTEPNGSVSSNTFQYNLQLPYPVIAVSSRKVIIETPLTERRGTVKELISIRDYEITIRGFIISTSHEFPEDEVTKLRSVYERNTPLSIKCPLTDVFLLRPDRSGSDQVVIRELKFPAVTGVKNVRPYELHLVSDEPFNLIAIS